MKTTLTSLIAAAFAAILTTSVSAAPAGKGPLSTGTYEQGNVQDLKKGDRYAVACMECKSVTVKEAADDKEAAALCHDGGTMHCPACKAKTTIKHVGPAGKGTTSAKVTYVNAEGKECMFIVPVKD